MTQTDTDVQTQSTPDAANPLVANSVCLMLSFDRLGIKKKLRDDQYVAGTAEKALTRAEKQTLDSPEYKKLVAFEGHVKHWLSTKALPSKLYRWGTYLIPVKALKGVDEFMANAKVEWLTLVDHFIDTYPERKTETMERLGTVGDEADYKTLAEVRDSFGFDYEYVTMSTPSTLKQISKAMFDREEERLKERLSAAEAEIVGAFRDEFANAVTDIKGILDGDLQEDGKPRRFNGFKIPKLVDYINNFKKEMNACGDDKLVALMDDAKKLLDGVDPKMLKKNNEWRGEISKGFGEISAKLRGLTVVRGKRLIDVDDEEGAA
jgi:hypothetical protein